ncbi:MAG: hypothetical protein WDM77_05770 [Steroidobacteraceae bacterium]
MESHKVQGVLDFPIGLTGVHCLEARLIGHSNFNGFALYLQSLRYGRPTRPEDPRSMLAELCGTCSSKHRLLASVAHESNHPEVRLTIGIYLMSDRNTPGVGPVLRSSGLESIPEAHCFLTVAQRRFDFTGLPPGSSSPLDDLIEEHFVAPAELPQKKPYIHLRAIAQWSERQGMSADAAWSIREECIKALAAPAGA